MITRFRAGALVVTIVLLASGCGAPDAPGGEPPPPAEPGSPDAPEPPGVAPVDSELRPVEIAPGVALEVLRTGGRRYSLRGATDRAARVRLEVEDGHDVLFGPVELEVVQGRFAVEVEAAPTDRSHIFFYLTDDGGERLAVLPVDTAGTRTTAGPPELLAADTPRAPGG